VRRLRRLSIGAWLGVLAVALYAWLPVHFAADVVRAAMQAERAGGDTESAPHRRSHHPAGDTEHHGGTCPICASASAAPVAATPPAAAALPTPLAVALPAAITEAHAPLPAASLTPYAPRGPPPAA
jgi:hypothetical protein